MENTPKRYQVMRVEDRVRVAIDASVELSLTEAVDLYIAIQDEARNALHWFLDQREARRTRPTPCKHENVSPEGGNRPEFMECDDCGELLQ